jgi:rSAM/selenodomain-associated transferase 1
MIRINSANRTLVIMAKAPRAGSVKTRLAGNLTVEEVTELYSCFLEDTLLLAREIAHVEVAIVCPAPDVEDLSRAVKNAVSVVPQTGKGLAAGLTSVFAAFTDSARRRVIAFNSDSPHLPARQLETAFEILETRDVVVGPTHDGGYYLVGARASHPGLFSSAGMGTGTALDELLNRAGRQGLSVGLTEPFYDIDIARDLSQLTEELRRAPEKAPRTAKWLADWAARSTGRSN